MTRKAKPKDLMHEIFPAEKRLARIDKLEIELDNKRATLPLTEYVRAKRALTVRRLQEFRRLERANNWNPMECLDTPLEPLSGPDDIESTHDPDPPGKMRFVHYAIFWIDLALLAWLVCLITPLFKK